MSPLENDYFVIEAWFTEDGRVLNLAARYNSRIIPRTRLVKSFRLDQPTADGTDPAGLHDAAATLMRAFLWDHGAWGRYATELASSTRPASSSD